jgi:hypothetical protein
MSTLSWLDFSEEDQRRAREIVALFSERESRDELGIGTIRDVFSNALFPGTSVIQTRLRYFLFVPWIFREAERQKRTGQRFLGWTDYQERRLIESLRAGGDLNGLIGREAGVKLKTLPSAVYWGGLTRWAILRRPATIQQLSGGSKPSTDEQALTELAERASNTWHPTLPEPPSGFFAMGGCDFRLTRDESEWLLERILETAVGTVLTHLVSQRVRPTDESTAPWEDATVRTAPGAQRRTVREAHRFSASIHGAALLYNLLLARRAVSMELAPATLIDDYRAEFASWWEEVVDDEADLSTWNLADFWADVRAANPRVSVHTIRFATNWIEAVRDGRAANAADEQALCDLIAHRELQQKGRQARLTNDRLMRQWSGASGMQALNYRWPLVRQLLIDLIDGLERADVGT